MIINYTCVFNFLKKYNFVSSFKKFPPYFGMGGGGGGGGEGNPNVTRLRIGPHP